MENIQITPKLIRTAKALSLFTIAYNLVEGLVSIYFGLSDDSVALAGFGVDSFIEVFSAVIVFWKISGHQANSSKEKISLRGIGCLFLILALLTLGGSALQLARLQHPETTIPGVIISTLSLSFMYFLWRAKHRVGKELNDPVILGDAACSLACIRLSVILLVGSLLFWFHPTLWWVDSVAAIGLVWFITKEGLGLFNGGKSCESQCGCG